MLVPGLIAAYLATIGVVLAKNGFVATPKNFTTERGHANTTVRFKQVPNGICETRQDVKSYSGYVDTEDDEHMFFWFFEARNQPKTAPLTIWFNGGPGSSSMIGLFQENGPCRVNPDGKLHDNKHSWSEVSNMLFIDQPVTTGFSYSKVGPVVYNTESGSVVRKLDSNLCPTNLTRHEACATFSLPDQSNPPTSTKQVPPAVWKTIQGFLGAFPDYANASLHLTTESYGGHFAPAIAAYILEQNRMQSEGTVRLHLDSVLIGNGWYDPKVQYQAYYNFTVSPGNTYDLSPFNESISKKMYKNLYGEGACLDRLDECYSSKSNKVCRKADAYCAQNVEALLDNYAKRDEYDMRELSPDPFPYENYVDYLNTERVQSAIGAYQNYSESSAIVGKAFTRTGDDGRREGAVRNLRSVLQQGVSVTLYAGDADYNCNWLGGEVIAHQVGDSEFLSAGYTDMESASIQTPGEVKQAGNLSFVRIYYSGHEVPFYQPVAALELLNRTIHREHLATGKGIVSDSYKTKGSTLSEYRQGNGTVLYHKVPSNTTYNTHKHRPN
ncbi:carboxypeptidase D [Malassezia yamatoensis]|uniref:Carboxypeptidase n=1 Tax=Malassezia yamatoensis TaxID=253288 RepID=A0AAJ6CH63_9BASI|nr:carboxypeptidase D [Malassezia yamatoensis]